jgi:gamma-glutamyl AIG2-like cyclotransferase
VNLALDTVAKPRIYFTPDSLVRTQLERPRSANRRQSATKEVRAAAKEIFIELCSVQVRYHSPAMSPTEKEAELLFAYGTLQAAAVQLSTFGRTLNGTEDALVGYRLEMITIADEDFVTASGTANHRNLEFTGNPADSVAGTVFKLTRAELEQSDAYEPAGYKRELIQSRSGLNVWVYLQT